MEFFSQQSGINLPDYDYEFDVPDVEMTDDQAKLASASGVSSELSTSRVQLISIIPVAVPSALSTRFAAAIPLTSSLVLT